MIYCEFTRNPEDVRAEIAESGISISEWARNNGFASGLVYAVLKGKRMCLRGQSHAIAVALGLKKGSPLDVRTLSERLSRGGLRQQIPAPKQEVPYT